MKKWLIVPPYDNPWLEPFVPQKEFQFELVPPPKKVHSWHFHNRLNSSIKNWWNYWKQSKNAWKKRPDGIITLFPQLALTVALVKGILCSKTPIIAWSFNLGRLYPGVKQRIARGILASVNLFVVHSKAERAQYSEWLGLPIERFQFVPLQIGKIPHVAEEEVKEPFIVSMGSAQRDYATLFEALRKLKIKTIVVAADHAISGLDIPECVEIRQGLTREACQELCQRARLSVVPIGNRETASGQVTLVEAMRMGRPIIATNCMGTEDYIISGETGILTEFKSVQSMSEAIERMWNDRELRERLGKNAAQYAEKYLSDEAVGKQLGDLLEKF